MPARAILRLLLAAVVFVRNLPGLLLFLRPGWLRVIPEPDGSRRVDAQLFDDIEAELAPLGFKRIGTHLESPPLGRGVLNYDLVNDEVPAFASAFRRRGTVDLYFLTPFEDGAFVLTADHKRHAVDRADALSGGLPGANPEQVLAAHRRRVEGLTEAGRHPAPGRDLAARGSAAQGWFEGAGSREIRLRHFNDLLLAILSFVILVAVGAFFLDVFG